ncbi:uncharacterized protein LTHEOB_10438 [Lasiodiplodia theobromae]|uniref:uncharacterized protein n=1 Tax=Lasiodiplodia theobromae TaxID=45133 RepID=UPI0015C368BD|nr:uncharacterized protein LTHEOB_10438 [Lasiodiplodia theobromae]KAF4539274.1 hypothetical protein LTHEOB_10438 [Lasiodiplodia theobromae]
MRGQVLVELLFCSAQLPASFLAYGMPVNPGELMAIESRGELSTDSFAQKLQADGPAGADLNARTTGQDLDERGILEARAIGPYATIKPENRLHAEKIKIEGVICTIAYKVVNGIVNLQFQGVPSVDDPINVVARFGRSVVRKFLLRAGAWVATGFSTDGQQIVVLEDPSVDDGF